MTIFFGLTSISIFPENKLAGYTMSAVIEKKQMKNGVVILTMNRPRVLNAMNKDLIVGLLDTFKEIEKEQKSRVVVLLSLIHI